MLSQSFFNSINEQNQSQQYKIESQYSSIKQQGVDQLYKHLHRQIKIFQQKLFLQTLYVIQQEYLERQKDSVKDDNKINEEKLEQKENQIIQAQQNKKQNKKVSDIYLKAFDKLSKLLTEIHQKHNKKRFQLKVENFVQEKQKTSQFQQSINQYINSERTKINKLHEFNKLLQVFFNEYGECLNFRHHKYQLTQQKIHIEKQIQIFQSKKQLIQINKKQYYSKVMQIFKVINQYQNQKKLQLNKLSKNYEEIKQQCKKEKIQLDNLIGIENDLYKQIDRFTRKSVQKQFQQYQMIQKHKQKKAEDKKYSFKVKQQQKKQIILNQQSDKLYIRPKSQIIFDQKYVNPQIYPQTLQKTEKLIQNQNHCGFIKGRYENSMQKEIKKNVWVIILLLILTFINMIY